MLTSYWSGYCLYVASVGLFFGLLKPWVMFQVRRQALFLLLIFAPILADFAWRFALLVRLVRRRSTLICRLSDFISSWSGGRAWVAQRQHSRQFLAMGPQAASLWRQSQVFVNLFFHFLLIFFFFFSFLLVQRRFNFVRSFFFFRCKMFIKSLLTRSARYFTTMVTVCPNRPQMAKSGSTTRLLLVSAPLLICCVSGLHAVHSAFALWSAGQQMSLKSNLCVHFETIVKPWKRSFSLLHCCLFCPARFDVLIIPSILFVASQSCYSDLDGPSLTRHLRVRLQLCRTHCRRFHTLPQTGHYLTFWISMHQFEFC